jgi:hypothetical protein
MVSFCSISKNTEKKKHIFPDIIFKHLLARFSVKAGEYARTYHLYILYKSKNQLKKFNNNILTKPDKK